MPRSGEYAIAIWKYDHRDSFVVVLFLESYSKHRCIFERHTRPNCSCTIGVEGSHLPWMTCLHRPSLPLPLQVDANEKVYAQPPAA